MSQRLVIVGASAAGANAAHRALQLGFGGEIIVLAPESGAPYYKPALSKQYLSGFWDDERIRLSTIPWSDLNIRSESAVSLDTRSQVVGLSSGHELDYDYLVLATGSSGRKLPNMPPGHQVTDLKAVQALRNALTPEWDVVIIGGGLIGSELGSTIRAMGASATIVDMHQAPLEKALGPYGNQSAMELHHAKGVRLMLGETIVSADTAHGHVALELASGQEVQGNAIAYATGVTLATTWLSDSGLALEADGGVSVGEDLLVDGFSNIAAAGDIASVRYIHTPAGRRVEHWLNAVEQGRLAIDNLLADSPEERRPFRSVPLFWTELHGNLFHVVGDPSESTEWNVIEGTVASSKYVVTGRKNGHPIAYLLANSPARLAEYRLRLYEELDNNDAALP